MNLKTSHKNVVYLAKGTIFNGRIETPHNVLLYGEATGEITTTKNLYVLPGAKIKTNLSALNIQIFGLVEGSVEAQERVIINEDARVFGDIKCESLKLLEGAIYSGSLEVNELKN